MNEAADLARRIADVASDSLATDIRVLDVHELTPIADIFVVASADNVRQLRAISENTVREMREEGFRVERREGAAETGWVVLDFGTVIVHLFTVQQRDFYRLEELWADAQRLLVIQ